MAGRVTVLCLSLRGDLRGCFRLMIAEETSVAWVESNRLSGLCCKGQRHFTFLHISPRATNTPTSGMALTPQVFLTARGYRLPLQVQMNERDESLLSQHNLCKETLWM